MSWWRALAALLAAIAAMPAVAQSAYSGCVQQDDNASCRARRERHQLGIYGVPPADQLARDGVEARRLFVLNARYGDVGLIAFSRDHGGAPRLSLQPPGYGLRRPLPLNVAVPLTLWEEVRAKSAAFHRGQRMAAVAPGDVCLDAWTYIVDTATPAEGVAGPRSAVRIVDQCSGPRHPYWLAERALGALPACAPLAGRSGSPYDAVMLCAALRAAPEAVAAWVTLAPLFEAGNGDAAAVRAVFAPDAALVWTGGPEADGSAADRWLRETQARSASLYFERIEALDGGRARLTGYLVFSQQAEAGDAREYRARTVLELARDGAGRLQIVSARIGRYLRS